MAGSMTKSEQCHCEDEIDRVETGLWVVAIVTGLQMAVWLGVAIWYMCTLCFKKLNKDKREEKMEGEWSTNLVKLEGRLKANKKVRKSRREEARNEVKSKQILERMQARADAIREENRIEEENQQFLNSYRRAAQSQL